MQGKTLFLNRVVSRSIAWQCRYPALASASNDKHSISGGRQIVVAAADADGVRAVFFSNLGSILDFSASWGDLERAQAWWEFVLRWNFWIVPSASDATTLVRLSAAKPELLVADPAGDPGRRTDADFLALLDSIERLARRLATTSPHDLRKPAEALETP